MDRGTDSPEAALQRLIDSTSSMANAAGWLPPGAWLHNAFNSGKTAANTWGDFWRRNQLLIAQDVKCSLANGTNAGSAPCSDFAQALEAGYWLGAEAGGRLVPAGFWSDRSADILGDSTPPPDSTRRWIWAGVVVAAGSMLVHLLWRKK